MNILSHYFADSQPGRPYYNFGLFLPDLAGAIQKGWKLSPIQAGGEDTFLMDLYEGVKRHYEVDGLFHNSPHFKDITVYIRKLFEEHAFISPGSRLFFAAHVFYELMLDRMILQQSITPAESLYNDLNEISRPVMSDFMQKNVFHKREEFHHFFERFQTHRYIFHYIVDEQLLFALNRVMMRAGLPSFPDKEEAKFHEIVVATEDFITPKFLSIFEALKTGKTD